MDLRSVGRESLAHDALQAGFKAWWLLKNEILKSSPDEGLTVSGFVDDVVLQPLGDVLGAATERELSVWYPYTQISPETAQEAFEQWGPTLLSFTHHEPLTEPLVKPQGVLWF